MEQKAFGISRLVKSNAVSKDLDSRRRDVAHVRHTELSADVVCSRCGTISRCDHVGPVTTLLGNIEDEVCNLEIGLRDINVENRLTSRDGNWNSLVDTSLASHTSGKEGQCSN